MSIKRILIFSLAYHPMVGGAEIAVKEITSRISDTRLNDTVGQVEFDIVTMRFEKSHPEKEKIGNVSVYRIGGGFGYLSKILFIPQASLFALRRNYDLYWSIMTYMLFPVVLLRLFGKKTPYVLTLQDGDPFTHVFSRLRIFVFKPLLSYGFRYASKIQTISTFLAEWARRMGYEREVEVIPNGVDLEKFKSVKSLAFDKDKITLITTSRLVEKNAVGDIIGALKFLPENVKLKILGSGPLEKVLKSKVESLKLENRVDFLGNIPNDQLPEYLHSADIFIRPSLSEGQGVAFIEAMAGGIPVIATPVGGIPDFLKHEETGLFCEVKNPESIAKQVRRLIEDEKLRKKIVENAKKMVKEKYDWDLITNEMKTRVFDKV